VKKAETQLGDMKREYPSTPEEAFEASIEGAYYSELLAAAEFQGRIGDHGILPDVSVNTAWDIGVGDYTAIWLWQQFAGKIGLVGYYENSGEGMPHYLNYLKGFRERTRCTYGTHAFPHDAKVKEWGTSRTRLEQFADSDLGRTSYYRVIPRHSLEDGINAVRATLGRCWFDSGECADGIRALKAYRKEWSEERGVWLDKPRHDHASHGADAFRQIAMFWREQDPAEDEPRDPIQELLKPKTLNEMLEEYDEEMAEWD
jgi:hypothetical protein